MAAHAMGSHEVARVTNAPFHAGTARAVGKPRVDLSEMVIKRLAHCHPGVVVRCWTQQTQFDLIARRIPFCAEEVSLPRLEEPIDLRAMALVLLMNPFVLVPSL